MAATTGRRGSGPLKKPPFTAKGTAAFVISRPERRADFCENFLKTLPHRPEKPAQCVPLLDVTPALGYRGTDIDLAGP